jgi:hypothetical protein
VSGRYAIAILVAFLVSVASFWFLFLLGIHCDYFGVLGSTCVFSATMLIVGFAGVFCGTICLPETERRRGSKRLLITGLAFSFLPSSIFFLYPLVPLALGGLIPVFLFKKQDQELSSIVKDRRLGIFLSAAILLTVCFIALLIVGGEPTTMTKEKAMMLLGKAGGTDKINEEAKALCKKAGTNDFYFLDESDRTNFSTLCNLGRLVNYTGGTSGSTPVINVEFGTHFHRAYFLIFPLGIDLPGASNHKNEATYFDTSKCIQITTNIFVSR